MNKPQPPSTSNFIKQIVEADLASGKHKTVVTRFPPEPNGYLHGRRCRYGRIATHQLVATLRARLYPL